MGLQLKPNAINQISKDTVLLSEHETVSVILLVVKGRVRITSRGSSQVVGSGAFLGVCDLFLQRAVFTYTVIEDASIYAMPVTSTEDLDAVFSLNKDYRGLLINYLDSQLTDLVRSRELLVAAADGLFDFIRSMKNEYAQTAARCGVRVEQAVGLDAIAPYSSDMMPDERKLQVYQELSQVPADMMKAYYVHAQQLGIQQIEEISGLIAQITLECIEITDYIEELFSLLIGNGDQCIYFSIAKQIQSLAKSNTGGTLLTKLLDRVVDEINEIETLVQQKAGRELMVDRKRMEDIYCTLMTGEVRTVSKSSKQKQMDPEMILKELKDSLQQILKASTLDTGARNLIRSAVEDFVAMPDRLSTEDADRDTRRALTMLFYDLYESVFMATIESTEIPLAVQLFLNYAYIDERLLTKEQLINLVSLEIGSTQEPCAVYTIREWLLAIYRMEKEPSKNEFDMDYTEWLRDRKKQKDITEEQEKELQQNAIECLRFEIKNMFAYNHKIVYGQISSFIPVLHRDMFISDPEKMFLSKQKVNEIVNTLVQTDFSVFYREVLFFDKELRIEKEYLMKEVYPDIILLPTVGKNASMWQEITAKRRDREGRFIMPFFVEGSANDLMVRLFGRFRWELCRTVAGTAWNNIKYKSLTAEYMDYIQFYRKNHELSEERKEKIKLALQKARNSVREVFVLDYELWIRAEAFGSLRLNKIAREILASYIPFPRNVREHLKAQPLFEEAMARFTRESNKKVQELENRHHYLQKDGIQPTREMLDTLDYYKYK